MDVSVAPATLEGLDRLDTDTLVLFVPEDVRPLDGVAGLADWRLTGRLSRLLAKRRFTGARGEQMLSPGMDRLSVRRILTVGVGPVGGLDAESIGAVAQAAGEALRDVKAPSAACGLPGDGRSGVPLAEAVSRLRRGLGKHFKGRLVIVGDAKALREVLPG